MEGHATISADVLARYAADAARDVAGVRGLSGRRAVRVVDAGEGVTVELHLELEWGASVPAVGRAVQEAVRAYLARMTDLELSAVNVAVDAIS